METGKNETSVELESYSLIQQIKSESIDIDKIDAFSLYYLFGKNQLLVGVVDNSRGKYILFEKYKIEADIVSFEYANIITDIIDNHIFLKAGFWKNIRISFQNNSFSLIPNSLFEKESASLYLAQTKEFDEEIETAEAYKHLSLNAINVFSCNKRVQSAIKDVYQGKKIEIVHETSAFIEGCFREQIGEEENVFLSVEEDRFIMVVIKKSKLQYCNVFKYKTVEDFAYYLLYALKELNLDPETIMLKIWGEITYDSKLYDLIYKYVRNVELGSRPNYLNFSYHFDELLDQRYFTLYSQHLCE